MKYQLLDQQGNPTQNIIMATEEFMLSNYSVGSYVEIVEPNIITPKVYEWYIDIGPFFDRFGQYKMSVLTSTDSVVQALLKDIQVRKWVNLKLPEVAQSLQYIGTIIPAIDAQLQDYILNTPVSYEENMALRKLYFNNQ